MFLYDFQYCEVVLPKRSTPSLSFYDLNKKTWEVTYVGVRSFLFHASCFGMRRILLVWLPLCRVDVNSLQIAPEDLEVNVFKEE